MFLLGKEAHVTILVLSYNSKGRENHSLNLDFGILGFTTAIKAPSVWLCEDLQYLTMYCVSVHYD